MIDVERGIVKAYRLVENFGEDKQEDCVQEVDHHNGDVERIHLLVHVRAHDADADQEKCLDNDKSDRLGNAVLLSQCDEHSLNQEVYQNRHDEEVSSSLELDVEEAPLVE